MDINISKTMSGVVIAALNGKSGGGISAELVNISSSSRMEIVCIDYLTLERSKEALNTYW